jgi:hypothetical protein
MGRLVVACFRPLPGKQQELRALTATHVTRLRALGLVTDRVGVAMEADDGCVIEVFEWVSSDAIAAAHEHAEVLAMWQEYEACCTYVPLTEVPGASDLFPDYAPLATEG